MIRNARIPRPAPAESWRLSLCFLNWQDAIISKSHCPAGRPRQRPHLPADREPDAQPDPRPNPGRSPSTWSVTLGQKAVPSGVSALLRLSQRRCLHPGVNSAPTGHLKPRTVALESAAAPTSTLQVNKLRTKVEAPQTPWTPVLTGRGPGRGVC